ncbi:UNVERIFIED_CONTAM: putative mitochondrial protein [Sesamum radiatum]|uniref:Mitochondrial protein n=1 Tax=Sesamum radiatum TaxID=300843 RepID=A0AAW2REL5_SESRA
MNATFLRSFSSDEVERAFIRCILLSRLVPMLMTELSDFPSKSASETWFACVVFGSMKPERGIRQGNPFSPYLFLLCAEAFSNLIQQEERVGNIKGFATCQDGPCVSHLLFADGTLIFCQATREARLCIKKVLHILEEVPGLK